MFIPSESGNARVNTQYIVSVYLDFRKDGPVERFLVKCELVTGHFVTLFSGSEAECRNYIQHQQWYY